MHTFYQTLFITQNYCYFVCYIDNLEKQQCRCNSNWYAIYVSNRHIFVHRNKMLEPIKHILNNQRIILASGSPRRQEILKSVVSVHFVKNQSYKTSNFYLTVLTLVKMSQQWLYLLVSLHLTTLIFIAYSTAEPVTSYNIFTAMEN